jgi:hypothetical protein
MALTEADISKKLYLANSFRVGAREIRLMFLLPETLWRPLSARWWTGKEVSIIGGDEDGNYVLRHSDGTVRLWDHARAADEILAPSVRSFLEQLRPSSP